MLVRTSFRCSAEDLEELRIEAERRIRTAAAKGIPAAEIDHRAGPSVLVRELVEAEATRLRTTRTAPPTP